MKQEELKQIQQMLDDVYNRIVSAADDISYIADKYYEFSHVRDQLMNFMFDLENVAQNLYDSSHIPESITISVCGEEKEYCVGDKIGYIASDSHVYSSTIAPATSSNPNKVAIEDCDITSGILPIEVDADNLVCFYDAESFRNFRWNFYVNLLCSQNKVVSLKRDDYYRYELTVSDKESNSIIYHGKSIAINELLQIMKGLANANEEKNPTSE